MYELKPLSADAVPRALAKAERYRLLNEPEEAESICQDILHADASHQDALVTLILAITDQFRGDPAGGHVGRAQALLPKLADEYSRLYYEGLISERQARAHLGRGGLHSGLLARDWFIGAMRLFDRADAVRPKGNEDAVLRWNACARALNRIPDLMDAAGESEPVILSE